MTKVFDSAEIFFEIDCMDDEIDALKRQTIIDVAELALPFFENVYKTDAKPKKLIEDLRGYIENKISIDQIKVLRGACANGSRHGAYEAASYGSHVGSDNKKDLWKAYRAITAIVDTADAIAASKGHHICSSLAQPASYPFIVGIAKELYNDSA